MYVYILYSANIDRYYIGTSSNVERRIGYHNGGRSGSSNAYTKRARDWRVVFKRRFASKCEARTFETKIKKAKSKRFINNLIEGNAPR